MDCTLAKGWHEVLAAVRSAREGENEAEVGRPYMRCTEACLRASDYGMEVVGNPVFFGWSGCPVHGVEAQKASIAEILGEGHL